MSKRKQQKAAWEDQGVTPSQVPPEYEYDDEPDDDCFFCGGLGLDECECSEFEDTCCCLNPVPRTCPECGK